MDRMIVNGVESYVNALEKLGYVNYLQMSKLLALSFYRDFVYHDYRGILSLGDYHLIEQALDCLYGTTCLIPYPDYLKMGKLHIGAMTEMAQRIKEIEDTDVLKIMHELDDTDPESESDVMIVETEPDAG